MLLDANAVVDFPSQATGQNRPIERAIELGEDALKLTKTLIDVRRPDGTREVDLRAKNDKGETLLHKAAWVGNSGPMKALLETKEFGDMIDEEDKQGRTALHMAAFRAEKEVCQLLQGSGADVNRKERNGRRLSKDTPCQMAKDLGRQDNYEYFLTFGGALTALKFENKMRSSLRSKGAVSDGA